MKSILKQKIMKIEIDSMTAMEKEGVYERVLQRMKEQLLVNKLKAEQRIDYQLLVNELKAEQRIDNQLLGEGLKLKAKFEEMEDNRESEFCLSPIEAELIIGRYYKQGIAEKEKYNAL